jgi:N-acetylneuraminic acid mutarotase
VLGGCRKNKNHDNKVVKFDCGTQTWSDLADMPGDRFTAAACVLGDNIYVFGGHDGEAEKPTSTTFRFNTVDDKWVELASMPEVRYGHTASELGGLIYVTWGDFSATPDGAVLSSVFRFDPAANAWSTLAPMTSARSGHACFVLGGVLYAAGGDDGERTVTSCECYDVDSDSWSVQSSMALRDKRDRWHAVVVGSGGEGVELFDSLIDKAKRARPRR